MTAAVIALGLVVALLSVLVVGLLRSHAEILRRLHELGAGVYDEAGEGGHEDHGGAVRSPVEMGRRPEIRTIDGVPGPRPEVAGVSSKVHDISGVTPVGAARNVNVDGVEHATLLAFLSSGCATCLEFWKAFEAGEASRLPGRGTRLVIVTKSPEDESVSAVAGLAPEQLTTIMSSRAYEDYGVPVSPYFILVDGPTRSIVGEGAAATWTQVVNLLGQAAADAGMSIDDPSLDTSTRSARLARQGGREREARADSELAAAGIGPGHPSLYEAAFNPDGTAIGPDDPPGGAGGSEVQDVSSGPSRPGGTGEEVR